MTETVLTALRDVANRDLYRRNAFRVTGLPAGVDRRTTRQRQQQLAAMLEMGADLETTGSRDPDELRAAFDRILGDPRRRLVEEVFGEWGRPGPDCGCSPGLHALHDKAVRAHADLINRLAKAVIRDPVTAKVGSQNARTHWQEVLATRRFWQHLRHRVLLLDDLQLAVTAVDELREHLPITLAGPLIDLAVTAADPKPVVGALREWPLKQQTVNRLLADACTPEYDRLEELFDRLQQRLTDRTKSIDLVIADLEQSVAPSYLRLQAMLPSATNRRSAVIREGATRLFNNCAVELMERSSLFDPRLGDLLDRATAYVGDTPLRETIAANRRSLTATRENLRTLETAIDQLVAYGKQGRAKRLLRTMLSEAGDAAGSSDLRTLLFHLDHGTWYADPENRFHLKLADAFTPVATGPGRRHGVRINSGTALLVLIVIAVVVVLVGVLR